MSSYYSTFICSIQLYNYCMNRLLLIAVLFVMLATNFIFDYIALEQQIKINEVVNEFHYGVVELFEYLLPYEEYKNGEILI